MARKDQDADRTRRTQLAPTSLRLSVAELDDLKIVAAGMGVSVSEAARRAILAFTGRGARDVERQTAGELVSTLGLLHTELSAEAVLSNVDPNALASVLAGIEAACRVVVARYTRAGA